MFFFRKKRQRVLFDAPVAGQHLGALLERLISTLPAPEADEVSRVAALCRVLPFVSEKSTQVALRVFFGNQNPGRLFNSLRRRVGSFGGSESVFVS